MHRRLFIALIAVALFSCAPESRQEQNNRYFNLEGFTRAQVKQLDALRPTVEKTVASGARRETKRISSITWEKELDLFIQADLNKPAFRNSYLIEQPSPNVTVYTAKAGEDLPVKSLTIELNAASHQPERVKALMTSDNYLYHSRKEVVLHCGVGPEGNWLVRDYQVTGYQQLAFFEKKSFEISGKIM